MRDRFKFRGLCLPGDDFVYGNLTVLSRDGKHGRQGDCFISNSMDEPFAYLVMPGTVEKNTGLKDKNEELIYEEWFI